MNRTIRVSEIASLNSRNLKKSDNLTKIRYLDTGSLTKNVIDSYQEIDVLTDKIPSRAKRKLQKQTIIFSTVRPNQAHYGFFENPENDIIVSTGFTTIDVTDEQVDSKYLYYLLTQTSTINYLQTIAELAVTSYPSITSDDIGKLKFSIPDLLEQKKISIFLSNIDKKIILNNQINQELEDMAKTLYDYWFVQFDFPDENGKPYKSSGGKMVYSDQLKREIPEGWGVEKLDYFLSIKNGKDHKHLEDGNVSVYGSGGFMRKVDTSLFEGESILIPRKGTLNNVMYVNEPFWTVDTMFYTELKHQSTSLYIYYAIKDINFLKLNTGTGVPSMTASILNSLNIVRPSGLLIERYTRMCSQYYELIEQNNKQNQELTQLRDWLLPMLMNGQVRVE